MKTEILIASFACCWCAFDSFMGIINPLFPWWRRLINIPAPALFFYAGLKLLGWL